MFLNRMITVLIITISGNDYVCGEIVWNGKNWARGCEFNGNDLMNVESKAEKCARLCIENAACTHYAWTDHINGTCWMKKNGATRADASESSDSSAMCGIISGGQNIAWNDFNWAHRCDFKENDLSDTPLIPELCSHRCVETLGCTHFVWTDHNNGTCWLKQFGATKLDAFQSSNPLAVCGVISSGGQNIGWKGNNWAVGCDFIGNNLTNIPSIREDCRNLCVYISGCTHYTWTNHNKGTCWLKKNGATKIDAFYISNPLSECGVINGDNISWNENSSAVGCDFIGNDLKSQTTSKENCRNLCASTRSCTHYTWTNYLNGTCWMKKNGAHTSDAVRISDPSALCGIITDVSGQNFTWNVNHSADGCDFKGNDLHSALSSKDGCRDLCATTPKCTHFVWTDYDDGTCWLKNNGATKSDAIPSQNPSTLCGIIIDLSMMNGQNITWNENNSAIGCDFIGNHLTSVPSSEEVCRDLCRLTKGCTHFSWTSTTDDGGVCSMKKNGATKADAIRNVKHSTVCGIIISEASNFGIRFETEVDRCDYCKKSCSKNSEASFTLGSVNGSTLTVQTRHTYSIRYLDKNVTELDLASNGLKELSIELFVDLKHLEELKLSNNELEGLMPGTFKHQQKLHSLFLDRNRLQYVTNDAFQGLSSLRLLDISCNNLGMSSSDIFSGTSIKGLELEAFGNMESLIELNLSHNNLTSIYGSVFRGLRNLKIVRINDNHLKTIHSDAFSHTPHLEEVYLGRNQLTFADADNNLSLFQHLQKLKQLHLQHNRIANILPDWRKIPELMILSLGSNQLTTLNSEDFNFASSAPVVLSLEDNNISVNIPDTIDDINNVIVVLNTIDCCNVNVSHFMTYVIRSSSRIRFVIPNLSCSSTNSTAPRSITEFNFRTMTCPMDECPLYCRCSKKPFDNALIFNCSYANLKLPPTFAYRGSYSQVELHIDHNNLFELPHVEPGLNITLIQASHNLIKGIHSENLPLNLRVLNVSHNQIQRLDERVFEELNNRYSLQSIALGNNPWLCDCSKEAEKLVTFVKQNKNLIKDLKQINCPEQQVDIYGVNDQFIDNICLQLRNKIVLSVLAVLIFFISFFSILYFKYQQTIKIWLYAHNMCLCWVDEDDLDKDKTYDAFVSYSHLDEEFAIGTIVAQLENGTPSFKTCVHERDWPAGGFILESIAQSITNSRRTVIILSQNFLKSMWGRTEFQYAHDNSMAEKRVRVIIIIYGDIGDIDDLDPDLQSYLWTNTYMKWGEKWFWEKLRYALGHKP